MAIIKKFLVDSITMKWYRDFVLPIINTLPQVDGLSRTYIKEDKIQGKAINVIIQIRFIAPDFHVLILPQQAGKSGNLSSGLSITELNDSTFKQFYPRDGSGFQDYSQLFRSSSINSNYPYFKGYQGKSVNQSHYVNGRQFTGTMAEKVQALLGTTNIDIYYQNLWTQTNGLYIDNQDNYWLITIKNNTSNDITRPNNGVFARKLTTIQMTDDTIKTVNGSTAKVNYKLVDGVDYLSGDTLLLSFSQFYNGFALSLNQGWSFNKKGNKIQNISFGGNITGSRYEITINEKNENGTISLEASYSIVESGSILLNKLFSVMTPLYNDYNSYSMEQVHNFNYSQVKYNPIAKVNLPIAEPSSINQECKIPLQCYFDEQDNIKVIYYYFKKTPYATPVYSSNGFTQDSDFANGSFTRIGDLQTGTLLENINSNYLYNYKIKHGIMVNDNLDLLVEDDGGAYTNFRKVELCNGERQTDFAYKVENNLTSVDLKPYRDFDLGIDLYNEKIVTFQGNYNTFRDLYFNTNLVTKDNLLIADDYVLDKQFKEINDRLDFDTRFTKINEVHALTEIKKLNVLDFKNIYLPYLLYEIEEEVLSIFTTITDTYKDSISNKLDSINTLMTTYFGSSYVDYYKNLRKNYKNLFNYFRSKQDKAILDISYINSVIKDLNDNHVPVINAMIDSINTTIDIINNYIDEVNVYVSMVDFYNNLVDQFNSNIKGYSGIFIDSYPLGEVKLSATNKDVYFIGKKVYFYKDTNETSYRDRQITRFSFMFNNANRNSLNVYSQKDSFDKIISQNNATENIYQGISNEYCLYKQNNNNNVLGDFEKVEVFYNRKRFTYTDYIGNEIVFEPGTNITAIDEGFSVQSDNLSSVLNGIYYNAIYLFEDYVTIPKDTVKYNLSNMKSNNYVEYKEEPITETKIQTIDKEIINQPSVIKNDTRLIHTEKLFGELTTNNYNYENSSYNQLYFNMLRDSNSFHYVISKDITSSYESKQSLTNITKYSIMNLHYVNFLGLAFDKQ